MNLPVPATQGPQARLALDQRQGYGIERAQARQFLGQKGGAGDVRHHADRSRMRPSLSNMPGFSWPARP